LNPIVLKHAGNSFQQLLKMLTALKYPPKLSNSLASPKNLHIFTHINKKATMEPMDSRLELAVVTLVLHLQPM
jgi:hypothetical protein